MTASPYTLQGKVALVTGAASGIGLATATLFAELGASVIATDIDADALAAAGFATGTLALAHDVASEAGWSAVYAAIRERYGQLDVLVNNAGIMVAKPFAEAGIDVLRRQLRINVESVYMGMHGALPLLREAIARGASTASIINIASIYGKVGGEQYAAYSATKGAVRALTKAVAIELATSHIRVNAVLPGPVLTNLSATWDPPLDAEGNPLTAEQALAAWARLIPMGRLGQASDIAPLVAYLASDLAGFITGSEFTSDGGYTAA
jgi:NAD(P)-dependent dehydrogenase (short-subunit alcohol dehydrogenase family)